MSPEQRAVINQQNATHSTGPVTESGKATVSGNATRHGLAGKSHAVLKGEEDAFAKHLAGFRETYNPQSAPEESLVKTLAENFWRLERAHRMESAAFQRAFAEALEESPDAIAAVAHAAAFSDPQKDLRNITLYAARIQRAIEKTTAQLKSLQDERKTAYAKAEEEAILLTHLANTHKKVSEAAAYFNDGAAGAEGVAPNRGGFVYSFDRIKAKIIRQGRLDEARARFAPADIASLLKGAVI